MTKKKIDLIHLEGKIWKSQKSKKTFLKISSSTPGSNDLFAGLFGDISRPFAPVGGAGGAPGLSSSMEVSDPSELAQIPSKGTHNNKKSNKNRHERNKGKPSKNDGPAAAASAASASAPSATSAADSSAPAAPPGPSLPRPPLDEFDELLLPGIRIGSQRAAQVLPQAPAAPSFHFHRGPAMSAMWACTEFVAACNRAGTDPYDDKEFRKAMAWVEVGLVKDFTAGMQPVPFFSDEMLVRLADKADMFRGRK
jgi:hypothetical protein